LINKVSDDFYHITLPMPFRLRHVHVYVLADGENLALFDTGFNVGGSYEILEKDLGSIGRSIKSIRDIYITHVHIDHCGMAGLIKEKSGATIHLSAAADDSNQNYSRTDLLTAKVKSFYRTHGFTEKEVDDLIELFSGMRNIIAVFKGDDRLQPNEIKKFGKWQFEAIFTPGHSNGHTCYYFPREGFLLSGDTILPHITPNLSPDLFDEQFRPLSSFLTSIKKVEKLAVNKIYPGHGDVLTDVKTRVRELQDHHAGRTQLILNCLGTEPKTTREVSREIFGNDLPDFDKFLALNETYVHLLELKRQNEIREEQKGNNLVYIIRSRRDDDCLVSKII